MAAQPGWWRRLETVWAGFRGECTAHTLALFGMVFFGGLLFIVSRVVVVALFSTGKLPAEVDNWWGLWALVALFSFGIYVCVSIRRDKEWAWWIFIFGAMREGSSYFWHVLDAWVGSHATPRGRIDWMSYALAAGFLIAPLKLYSDLKEMRLRKQAELKARGIDPTL